MSGEPIRRTPFASWKDPDAWMETMKGPKWKAVLKEEGALVTVRKQNPEIQRRIGVFTGQMAAANDAADEMPFECGDALIFWNSQFNKQWCFRGTTNYREARDIDCNGRTVWTTTDVGDGAESFALQMWSSTSGKPKWSHYPVGPELAFQNGYIYYLGVKNKLIYHELWRCDAKTGGEKTLLYKEKSDTVNLSLEKHSDGRLVLVRDNSQDKEYFEIKGTRLHPNHPYTQPKAWNMPHGEYGIDFIWVKHGLCITKQHGQKILWKVSTEAPPKKLISIPAGFIQFDPYSVWSGKTPCLVRVLTPTENPAYYNFQHSSLDLLIPKKPTGLIWKRITANSADGTRVHGIIIQNAHTTPTCLLCIGYGAYGLETGVPSVMRRWAPLVSNNWAILYTFLRGGGDHTPAWGKAGRREGRQKTVDDFTALVRTAQRITHISPAKTAIYGRSAGGLLMGMTLAQNPTGSLMGAVYTEVPYVDVLRTTTNNSLPLTQLEYNEFGDPMHRLEDFISVGLQSPADSAAVTASPQVFVLTRTAENDSQVYAYESVKWIRRLRSHDNPTAASAPKLCIVESGQGHFTPPDKQEKQQALDCAFLDVWCKTGTL
jgi:pimeloyl-ACP methyl ester carboxylesterase